MADPESLPLADLLEPRDGTGVENDEDNDFRLSLAIDLHREKAVTLRVIVVVEVIIALVLAREALMLFVLGS